MGERLPSVPSGVIKAISTIDEPTEKQRLIMEELTQTFTPELGPILAEELANTVKDRKPLSDTSPEAL